MSGRIAKYSDEAYQDIIRDLADGVPLHKAIGGDNRPGRTMFYRKIAENAELARDYDRAMVMRAQVRIAKIEEVIEQVLTGMAEPAAAKVALDSLRWLCQKEDPKRYSDVQRSEITGRDGAPLIEQPRMSDFEMARLLAHLLDKGTRAGIEDRGDLIALPEAAP
jgi:hypothetical protein